jgi:hypothetical protein
LLRVEKGFESFSESRAAAMRVGVINGKDDQIQVLFENGEVFSFPKEKKSISKIIRKRFDEMVLTGLLTLMASPAISRIQIWPDQSISNGTIKHFLAYLTELGFDDFDIAFEIGRNAQ